MSLGPLYMFLGEVSVQVLCPFFNWVVCLPGVESCEFFIYFGERKKELILSATAWVELESIMLSEISQVVGDKYHMISPLTRT